MSTARIIQSQIGGKALFMLGACNFATDGNDLRFKIKGCKKINFVIIRVNSLDLYDIEFIKIKGYDIKKVSEYSSVYAESLRTLISSETGLAVNI